MMVTWKQARLLWAIEKRDLGGGANQRDLPRYFYKMFETPYEPLKRLTRKGFINKDVFKSMSRHQGQVFYTITPKGKEALCNYQRNKNVTEPKDMNWEMRDG
jgi:DNA-binding PadR family transcriptional regulator